VLYTQSRASPKNSAPRVAPSSTFPKIFNPSPANRGTSDSELSSCTKRTLNSGGPSHRLATQGRNKKENSLRGAEMRAGAMGFEQKASPHSIPVRQDGEDSAEGKRETTSDEITMSWKIAHSCAQKKPHSVGASTKFAKLLWSLAQALSIQSCSTHFLLRASNSRGANVTQKHAPETPSPRCVPWL